MTMLVDDMAINVPAATPLSRSLSKSVAPRDYPSKPHQTPRPQGLSRAEDDISVQPHTQVDDQSTWSFEDIATSQVASISVSQTPTLNLEDLPSEILELIAGYVVGHLGSAGSGQACADNAIRNWNEIMRHPRRRNMSDLALISPTWRRLIQERLFRHIKVQGTVEAQEQCQAFFVSNSHLQHYVRHLQVIVPIWEMRRGLSNDTSAHDTAPTARGFFFQTFQTIVPSNAGVVTPTQVETSQIFQLASKNATMDEIFAVSKLFFPEMCALTIEAGHCKHPPQIKFFRPQNPIQQLASSLSPTVSLPSATITAKDPLSLPTLPSVKTLILKGAWNIVRTPADFQILANALPQLQEVHCNYHALKTDAYIAMCVTLRQNLASNITHLNIGLDGLYTKQMTSFQKWKKIYPSWHVCLDLGRCVPQLETLTYTGRSCQALFNYAMVALRRDDFLSSVNTRLKSIDLIVNNVCCHPELHSFAAGIQHTPFIEAFEALISAAVRALNMYQAVAQLRIRYIDLDSPAPLLNPTFHIERGRAWGFWSEEIVTLMRLARPNVKFLGLRGRMGTLLDCDEQEEPKRSLSVEYYRAMAHGGVLIH